jgi:rare lipoprotein A
MTSLSEITAHAGSIFHTALAKVSPNLGTEVVKRFDRAKRFVPLPKPLVVAWRAGMACGGNEGRGSALNFPKLQRDTSSAFLRPNTEEAVLTHFCTPDRRVLRDALIAVAISAAATASVPQGADAHALSGAKQVRPSAAAKTTKKEIGVSRDDREQRGIVRAKLSGAIHPTSTATVLGVVEREHGDGNSGIASVYSDTRTASGEAMIAGAMTAAHRTLPFGTRVTVTNRHNGRAVLVQITDRGPFVRGRVIDLSPAAGRLLGIDGLASVSLAVVSHGEKRSLDQATCRVRRRISRAMRAR